MEDYSNLYDLFEQANQQDKVTKFNYFVNRLIEDSIADLDKYYFSDKCQYEVYLNNLKKEGFKVLRNSEGKHKVVLTKDAFANPHLSYIINMATKC